MKDIATYALDALLKAGADKASAIAAKGRKDEFNLEANKFSLLRTLFDDSLSLKAIMGGKKGVLKVNKLDRDSVDAAVADCISLAKQSEPDDAEDIAPLVNNKNFDQRCGGADLDKLFSRAQEFVEQTADEFPKIMLEGMQAEFSSGSTVYLNSNGVEFSSETEAYSYGPIFSAKEGEKSSSFNYCGALMRDLHTPFMDLGMTRQLLDESARSLDTRVVEEKFVGKVIISPAEDFMIWVNLMYNFLLDHCLISGISRWKDALGTQVADPKLTFRLAPLHPLAIAGERFTEDGFESSDVDIIKNGILNSFALSLYGANKTGKPRANNTSWNFEVEAGDQPLSDMIKNIDQGILINRFSGAMPGPSGDVSGVAKNSFLIKNGQITDPLSETTISYNLLDTLKNIPAISKERITNGQSIIPWISLDGITISGA